MDGSFNSLVFLFYTPIFVTIWTFYLISRYWNHDENWDREGCKLFILNYLNQNFNILY